MEDQISDDVVKDRFGRLLEEVQTISSKMCSRHEGTVQRVLVESCNEHDERLMTGRLSNNLLVHFPGDESRSVRLAGVSLDECKCFIYRKNCRKIKKDVRTKVTIRKKHRIVAFLLF